MNKFFEDSDLRSLWILLFIVAVFFVIVIIAQIPKTECNTLLNNSELQPLFNLSNSNIICTNELADTCTCSFVYKNFEVKAVMIDPNNVRRVK